MNIYNDIKGILMEGGIEAGEAKAVSLLMMEKVCGMTTTEVLMGSPKMETHREELLAMSRRVAAGEPVQYVLGEADFCGMRLKVGPGVLIPRKETEELVAWAAESCKELIGTIGAAPRVLDIGTGSGCIAIALAKQWPETEVEAWDVSEEALAIARENAERMEVKVKFSKVDVLAKEDKETLVNGQPSTLNHFHLIVSNPPYICQEEAAEMERNVLEHEPDLALFVPDDDPLRFYRRIAELSMGERERGEHQGLLADGGQLFFEVNRRFGHEVVKMLERMGFREVELRKDIFGNDRMVKAIKG